MVLPVLGFLWPRLASEAAAAAYEPSGAEMLTFQLMEVCEWKLMYLNVDLHKTKKDKALISDSTYVLKSTMKSPLRRNPNSKGTVWGLLKINSLLQTNEFPCLFSPGKEILHI